MEKLIEKKAEERRNRGAEKELGGVDGEVADADEQDAPPPVGVNRRGEERGDGK